jgi:hypothetical protein
MATPAQLIANSNNAHLSTGPKSEEGKQRASQNARKHGFSSMLPASAEEAAELAAFTEKLKTATKPEGTLEEDAFFQIRDAAWRLEKIRRATSDIDDTDPLEDEAAAAELQARSRYRAAAEMQFYHAIATLQELQTARLGRQLHMTEAERGEFPEIVPPTVYAVADFCGYPFNKADRAELERLSGLPFFAKNSPNEPNPPCYS